MILITKNTPPRELVEYQKRPDPASPGQTLRYDGAGFNLVKPIIREALAKNQYGLCCYCNQRIYPNESNMKIEHHTPQNGVYGNANLDLDWNNIFGACPGSTPDPEEPNAVALHCDTSKADRAITINPTFKNHMDTITYQPSGRICSSQYQAQLDNILNLNKKSLIKRRKTALDALQLRLRQEYQDKTIPIRALQNILKTLKSAPNGELNPYTGFLFWWLEKRIKSGDR